ncbi:MAG TPA: hypothetical protein VNS32_18740, partial [Flavisolibacter sp.]|nr:hypothetical protein [Flavisolibacter sp.]
NVKSGSWDSRLLVDDAIIFIAQGKSCPQPKRIRPKILLQLSFVLAPGNKFFITVHVLRFTGFEMITGSNGNWLPRLTNG